MLNAQNHNQADAFYKQAKDCLKNKKMNEAIHLLEQAAELKHADAGYAVAEIYERSAQALKNKPEKQLELLQKAAKFYRDAASLGSVKAVKKLVKEKLLFKPLRPEKLPLSFAQQRLWFLHQLLEEKATYNIPAALRLTGSLNLVALQQAFAQISARHANLRTVFPESEGEAEQVIRPAADFSLPVIDISALTEEAKLSKSLTLVQAEAVAAFDLAQGPLLRAQLVRLAEAEHILLVNMHHIIADGWSMGVLIKEISAYYNALVEGKPLHLTPLPIQYVDYALWQREYLQGEVLDKQLAYWQEQLKDAPEALNLPTDKPRPQLRSSQGASFSFSLAQATLTGLKQLNQQQGATLFMGLLAAFKILLHRYSSQTDLVVGSPIANRQQQELEGLIGMFVNTLALRSRLNPQAGFIELLSQVKQTTLMAYEHQDVPFEQLVEQLNISRDLSRSPLFQVMLVLQNNAQARVNLAGLQVEALALEQTTAKFDLTLNAQELNDGSLALSLEYATDLFEAKTIARMAEHFKVLVQGIVEQPEQAIAKLPLLTPAEQQTLLVDWNQTEAEYPKDQTIQQLFEAQAEKTPHNIAVVFADKQLTYRELNEKANQLAHYLRSLGVKRDTFVAISLERSLELIIGLLAILKAGGAYVPLDSSYPAERLQFMLEDTKASILLTQSSLQGQFTDYTGTVLTLDKVDVAKQSTANPAVNNQPSDLAYVIYTSGSAGKPKGVMVEQRSVINLLSDFQRRKSLGAAMACGLWTSISFDVSVYELFASLLYGGSLHVLGEELRADADKLLEYLAQQRISSIYLPPFLLSALAERITKTPLAFALSRLLVGVEPIKEELLQSIAQRVPGLQIINGYGPTETTVCATLYNIGLQKRARSSNTPIGRPVTNTCLYILDGQLQAVPVGVSGELYIGGVGVARGYLNRPELTAEKFIPNPFGEGRLYRTGDLVRYLADGNIEFLGRIDQQVKIRGFRIELGEIESVFRQQPSIADIAVIAREDSPGDKRLVAYLVNKEGMLGDEQVAEQLAVLQQALSKQLPDYMVPGHFMFLEELPLNANGKLDRKALPKPDKHYRMKAFVAPCTELEQRLAAIWAEVLHVDAASISVNDNFFDRGGHSLLATQLVAKVRQHFKVELALKQVFQTPSLAALAQELTKVQDQALAITVRARPQHIPLSYAQQRLWFMHELAPAQASYHIPLALTLTGELKVPALEQAFRALIARHEGLRTVFSVQDGEPAQVILSELPFSLPLLDISHLAGEAQRREYRQLAQQIFAQPFNLSQGPLVRAQLVKVADNIHRLLINQHHIISDGWSMGLMSQELSHYYNYYTQQHVVDLAPLPIQYADFALWQRDYLQGEVMAKQLHYWQQQLAEAPTLFNLPTDYPRPAVLTDAGGAVPLSFEAGWIQQLTARYPKASLFMLLLASFNALLYRYSGETDFIVGTRIANRRLTEVESLIGFFANTLALRCQLTGQESYDELVAQVMTRTLDAYAYQDVPFERLVEVLQVERSLSHAPLVQVVFNFHNTPQPTLALNGLVVSLEESLASQDVLAKTDLTVSLTQQPDGSVSGQVLYAKDLFKAATIERLTKHWSVLLQGLLAQPQQPLNRLSLLTAVEQSALMTVAPYPEQHEILVSAWERQVALTPQALAVVTAEGELTYAALNARANQLAHYLRQEVHIGAGSLVGIYYPRSVETIVAIIAILKTGAAYLVLDINYPQERLAAMVNDSDMSLLLTNVIPNLGLAESKVVNTQALSSVLARQPKDNLDLAIAPHALAYLIYTSGSTGKPKAVKIAHANVLNYIPALAERMQLSAKDVYAHTASFAFSSSVRQLFLPLLTGATIALATDSIRRDAEAFLTFSWQWQVSIWDIVPSFWQVLSELAQTTQVETLRLIASASEPLPWSLVAAWQAKVPDVQLLNMFGQTETAGIIATYPIVEQGQGIVPVGYPIANTAIYILDAELQPLPQGLVGDIYIGGLSVGLGYHRLPELTAQQFISHPVNPEIRLYKTGDKGCLTPEGALLYKGRGDNQIKLRGYRIELGEIENKLRQCADLNAVAVITHEEQGEKQLVAYLVNKGGMPNAEQAAEQKARLQQVLATQLPEYMVPSHFMFLDKLPLNANGKLDRKALPKPERRYLIAEFVAPRTALEQQLATIWADVLRLEAASISLTANFFKLGGHSLLATRLVSAIRSRLGLELSLRDVFQTTTLAELAKVLAQQAELPGARSIVAKPRPEVIPLSFMQQRLWFLDKLLERRAIYNMPPIAFFLTGPVNIEALQKTLSALHARHEVLRTCFIEVEGIPQQRIAETILPQLTISDKRAALAPLAAEARLAYLQTLYQAEAAKPFDLAQAPLLRTQLIQVEDAKYLLLATLHHIIGDGWSMAVLGRDISALYNHYAHGEPLALRPLAIQYADYALWQQAQLQGERLAQLHAYWQDQLAGAPTVLALPTDKPRPPVMTHKSGVHHFELPARLVNQLQVLAQTQDATLYMVLLASFYVLLYRYSGQQDMVVGSAIANRTYQETEDLLGFFVNTLALRGQLAPQQTFTALLSQVKTTLQGAYQHQEMPFEQLLDRLQVERDVSRNPLVQVMLQLLNYEAAQLQLTGLGVEGLPVELGLARFDVTFTAVVQSSGAIEVMVEYMADLYEAKTIARMGQHWHTLLDAIVLAPEQTVARLPLLTPVEQQALLIDWNQTQAAYPSDMTIHELFEAQVAKTPDNVALVFEDKQLTYSELNQKANQLAHRLKSLGVKSNTLVAISLERSLELMIGLLAILKAGGAYVPLDPSYPADRLHFMLEDTQAPILLTHSRFQDAFKPYAGTKLVLDTLALSAQPITNPQVVNQPQDLAYVIYTSGSTGRPKGVMAHHQGAVNRFDWMWQRYPFAADEVCCQKTSINFGDSVWESFGPLCQGVKTIIFSEAQVKDTFLFLASLERYQITRLVVVPSLLKVLLASSRPQALAALKLCVVSGEELPGELISQFNQQLPEAILLNLYGSSEVAADVSYYEANRWSNDSAHVPIGFPIHNTQLYVLDAQQQLVPMGIEGELYVGGAGVARGYLNRDNLTQEKFIANPFGNGKLYRTGDLVRHLADGKLEYLGRIDQQVKIRGFRIELGEIESAIRQQPGMREVAVIAREDSPGDKHLVAYLVNQDGMPSDEVAAEQIMKLQQALSQQLPEYMVPNSFMYIEKLPLNANGKLDRNALPKPEKHYRQAEFIAPSTVLEQQLAAIWAKVLQLEVNTISVNDNFFERGGHSLLLAQLVSCVNQQLAIHISVLEAFQHPTIASLLAAKAKGLHKSSLNPLLPVQTQGHKPALFLVHPAGGIGLSYLRLANLLPGQPIYAINDPRFGQVNGYSSLREMASMYIKLIKEVQPEGPYDLGGWSLGGNVAVEMAVQLTAQGERVNQVLLIDTANWVGMAEAAVSLVDFIRAQLGKIIDKTMLTEAEYEQMVQEAVIEYQRNARLLASYQPPVYQGSVTLLRAKDVTEIPETSSEARRNKLLQLRKDSYLRWEGYLTQLKVISVPGRHDELFDEVNLPSVRAAIITALTEPALPSGLTLSQANLLAAAERNDDFIVKLLLEQDKGLVNTVHPVTGRSALHWAACHGNKGLVDELVKLGANRQLKDSQGQTACELAELKQQVGLAYQLKPVRGLTLSAKPLLQETLWPVKTEGEGLPLFMIHAASGLAFPYLKLMGLNCPVYGIANPYYGTMQRFESIKAMATAYIALIKTIQPQGPYRLGGWSLGGVIALEMAQQLQAQGDAVAQVLMVDSVCHVARPNEARTSYRDAEQIIIQLNLADTEAEALREQYRQTYALLADYQPAVYDGKVLLLKALQAEAAEEGSSEALQAWRAQVQADKANGWQAYLPQLEVKGLEATHSELFDTGKVEAVIAALNEQLKPVSEAPLLQPS